MRRTIMHRLIRAGLAASLLLALPLASMAQDASPSASPDADEGSFLFVLSGTSGTIDGDTFTLEGVPAIVTFSDRPERIALDVPLEALVEASAAFADDPPNAALSVLGDDGITNVVLELTSATVDGTSVSFGYQVLAGDLPEGDFGPASLFVDSTAQTAHSMAQQAIQIQLNPGSE
jgi:hypothetical protein